MIVDMFNNKNVNPVVAELFIKDRKLNISLVFDDMIEKSFWKTNKNN